jgi:hypothetical protein
MFFDKVQVHIRNRIHNLELLIRILRKVLDSYRSGSTTLGETLFFLKLTLKVDSLIQTHCAFKFAHEF